MKILKMKNFTAGADTKHLKNERLERLAKADTLIKEENAVEVGLFYVDKGHKNGAEVHRVFSNGVVKIYNKRTCRFITVLIARPAQVDRYYQAINKSAPKALLDACRVHQELGLNLI